jgi:hypothetical protein
VPIHRHRTLFFVESDTNMKYRIVLSMPATVEVSLEVDADSQQDAIASGYDHAFAATPQSVKVVSVSAQAAMLDSCEAITAVAAVVEEAPLSPYATSHYIVQSFATPEALAANQPTASLPYPDYHAAVEFCQELASKPSDHTRRVVDKLGNKLFTMTNEFGRFVVVVYPDVAAYDQRQAKPWAGWLVSAKEAKRKALELLDAGKVYAVGVLDANTPDQPPVTIMTLTRSS